MDTRPSWYSYILMPLLGAAVAGIVVLLIINAFNGDNANFFSVKVIVIVVLFVVFFVWYAYAHLFKDTAEPDNGLILLDLRNSVDEIQLVEIVTMFPEQKEPSYCLVYRKGCEPLTIEFDEVSEAGIRTFCRENNITPADVIPPFAAMEYWEIGNRYLTLRNYKKKWAKDIRIGTDSIRLIEHVSEHPVSETLWYYRVHTMDGQQYEFGTFSVDKMLLEKYGMKYGFAIVEKKEYHS